MAKVNFVGAYISPLSLYFHGVCILFTGIPQFSYRHERDHQNPEIMEYDFFSYSVAIAGRYLMPIDSVAEI